MPYIKQERRLALAFDDYPRPEGPGELNYVITKLIDDYLYRKVKGSYADINEVIGVLECAKLEFYRRIAAPYEDEKCRQYGDVYSTVPK